ncbi:MAG: PilZ domain-containing protein [Planctomycetota bacterium]
MTQRSGPGNGRGNTIGQSAPQLRETLKRFDSGAGSGPTPQPGSGSGSGGKADRRYTRLPFRAVSLPVAVAHPGGNEVSLRLACRNISRRGLGFLHSSFVYPGTRVRARLPRLDGSAASVSGAVVRCDHREGVVHEIGVRLDEPIELEAYLRASPLAGPLSYETVPVGDLFGTLVYVDAAEANARVIRHFLRETPMRIHEAATAHEAAELARTRCDVVLIGGEVGADGAAEAVATLRNLGVEAAVLVTGPKLDDVTRASLRIAGADRYLESPFKQRDLLRHIAEFVLEPRTTPSERSGDQQTAAMLLASMAELGEALGGMLVGAPAGASGGDTSLDAYVVCQELQQIATALGLDRAAELAGVTAGKLGQGRPVSSLAAEVAKLLDACGVSSKAA